MNVSSRYLVKVALPEIGRATFGGLVKIYETVSYIHVLCAVSLKV